jgi:hypothetical protein
VPYAQWRGEILPDAVAVKRHEEICEITFFRDCRDPRSKSCRALRREARNSGSHRPPVTTAIALEDDPTKCSQSSEGKSRLLAFV